jgi:hypothetical protein
MLLLTLQRAPVPNGLGHVRGCHMFAASQVGHRTRHFKNAVIRTRRPVQMPGRGVQQALSGFVRRAITIDVARAEVTVGRALARQLHRTRLCYPRCDHAARFPVTTCAHALGSQRRDRQLDIDAIEQGPRDTALVAQHGGLKAAAFATGVPEPAARARIHRRDELEARRKIGLMRRARNRDLARFERLAQHFEHAPVELGQLVGVYVRANVSRVSQNPVVKGFGVAASVRVLAGTWECFILLGCR